MKDLHKLLNEVANITLNIETNYPELYKFLDEIPVTIPSDSHPHIDTKVMTEYLDSLKELLYEHIETHKKK
ncbi:MAG: hypothetical protein ACQETL_02675 [Bacteroidota bacterium]